MQNYTAQAHANIALVKYWGKQESDYNIPATPSLSITLDTLVSRTTVTTDNSLATDTFVLNNQKQSNPKVLSCLKRMRALTRTHLPPMSIVSENNFPTGAGLASSASGFAALVTAIDAAANLKLSREQLSVQARIASGSAARSIFGGFVCLNPSSNVSNSAPEQASDAWYARQLLSEQSWPMQVVVAICAEEEKDIPSSEGMQLTRRTSPYFNSWVDTTEEDFQECINAVLNKDFEHLALISENSCLKMHGLMLSTKPALVYWNAATMACIQALRALRKTGVPTFFTIDAGPQVKAICLPSAASQVQNAIAEIPGVKRTFIAGLGSGACIVDSDN
ncbi:MAG: diphosphomevalonate decarboxylase [Pseudomonadales bacterium]|nr:diphosphomevalonate decarboxylase [Pseudomonadales bacterium]